MAATDDKAPTRRQVQAALDKLTRAAEPYDALREMIAAQPSLAAAARDACGGASPLARRIGLNGGYGERRVRALFSPYDRISMGDLGQHVAAAQTELEVAVLAILQRNRDALHSVEELANLTDRSPASIKVALEGLSQQGYQVRESIIDRAVTLPSVAQVRAGLQSIDFRGDELLLGIVSDTHLGHREADLGLLHSAYDLFAAEGVRHVMHCGDLTEGPGNRGYHGHTNACLDECQTWLGLERYTSANYPVRDGIQTHCISSSKSHCGWEWCATGRDIVADICNGRLGTDPLSPRADMEYLGQDVADITLGPEERTRLRLHHPDGKSAYALTYHAQKFVEAMPGGSKPHIYLIGHYHSACTLRPRNVETALVPGMQRNSDLFRRMGREPVMGAYILRARLDTGGSLRSVAWEDLIHYYLSDEPHAE